VGGQLLVSISHRLNLVLDEHLVEGIEEDLLSEASDTADTRAAADDGGWDNNVVEGSLVHGPEGAAARALLASVSDLSLGVNGPVDDNDDVARELLLEVVDNLAADLLVETERAEGDLDHDVFGGRAVIGLERLLLDGVDVDRAELTLDVFVRLLESSERLGGILLELGRLDLL